jgi:hypothetical protein
MLHQKIFGTYRNEQLLRILREYDPSTVQSYTYHLVVYVNDQLPGRIIHVAGDESQLGRLNKFPKLSELLALFPEPTFDNCLLISTIFPIDPWYLFKRNKECFLHNQKSPEISKILSGTRGLLIYAHQLEQIYCMLTGRPYPEAISFRKDWNLKRPSSRQKASELYLTKDYTLADLLNEATINEDQFVYNANFSGAYRLLKYLLMQQ